MEAGLVKSPGHVEVLGAVGGSPGASDQENKRGRAILQCFGVYHLLAVPDQVRQLALGKDIEPALLEGNILGQVCLVAFRRAHHGGDKAVSDRIPVVLYCCLGGGKRCDY